MLTRKLLSVGSYPDYIAVIWERTFIKNWLRILGVSIAARGRFFGVPIISRVATSRIIIGRNCKLCSKSSRTALGVNHAIVLRTLCGGAAIIIGDETGISGGSICAAKLVKIGNECLIGANVTITDTDFHPTRSTGRRYAVAPEGVFAAPVIIEDNVFIGAGAFVLKGVTIGRNSVVGAGAVVTKSVPPNTIVAGNPARIIKSF